MKKSEESQHIYKEHFKKLVETEFGKRVMTEIGNIKGLEIGDTANYLLMPMKQDGKDSTMWIIKKISDKVDIPYEELSDLD